MKPTVHDTKFMHSIMANIKLVYITQGFSYGCFKPCSGLYINCTTPKLVVHITNTICSVLVQTAALYTYNKVVY